MKILDCRWKFRPCGEFRCPSDNNNKAAKLIRTMEQCRRRHKHRTREMDISVVPSELVKLSLLAFFAILGLLSRKGLTVLTTYDSSYLGGIVWCNFTACVFMGALVHTTRWPGIKSDRYLYLAATTGYCGSFSSFSSMMLESFLRSADIDGHYPNAGYGVMEVLSVLITQVGLSVIGFKFGSHLIHFCDPRIRYVETLEWACAIAGVVLWAVVIILMCIPGWRLWMFASLVSPLACWARYYISKWLNPKFKEFPLGTFMVNMLATLILAALTLLNRGKTSDGGRIVNSKLACQLMSGLDDGLCGTMSTVSTFVAELHVLSLPRGYIYATVSLAVCYCLMIVVLGSYNWSVGLTQPLCS